MDAQTQQLTDVEKALVEEHTGIVFDLCRHYWQRWGLCRHSRFYGIDDLFQAGFIALTEAILAWREVAKQYDKPSLPGFLGVHIHRRIAQFAEESSSVLFIPHSVRHEARNPREGKAMSEARRRRVLRGKPRDLQAVTIRTGFRRGRKSRPLSAVSETQDTPGWLTKRERVREAMIAAASMCTGARGQAAELLVSERTPVSLRTYRTGLKSIADRSGLTPRGVESLERSLLHQARRAMAGEAVETPGRRWGTCAASEPIRAAIAAQGKDARMAVFAAVSRYSGRNAMAAILAAATRILADSEAPPVTRPAIGRWAGVSTATVKYLEGEIIRRAGEKLGVAA